MPPTSQIVPVFDHSAQPNVGRMPTWVRQPLSDQPFYSRTAQAIHQNQLHTVCEEARCPNRGECWSRGTATLMLLGDTCTRACGFCAVKTGKPTWFDAQESQRVADAVIKMQLDYVVLTSVNRDDLPDGGASVFADSLRQIRLRKASIGLEVLTPDFWQAQTQAVKIIAAALDEDLPALIWGHNVETVPRLYKLARKGSRYDRSLRLLELAAAQQGIETKSAIMLGLGETQEEVLQVLRDLRNIGVSRIALGQYLRPTRHHLPVKEYVALEDFAFYDSQARKLGFSWVKAGPLVRSSYHASDKQS